MPSVALRRWSGRDDQAGDDPHLGLDRRQPVAPAAIGEPRPGPSQAPLHRPPPAGIGARVLEERSRSDLGRQLRLCFIRSV
jgi:hypothetical protein